MGIKLIDWARHIMAGRDSGPPPPEIMDVATLSDTDCIEALAVAAQISDYRRRRTRNSDVTRKIIERYRSAPVSKVEGQELMTKSDEHDQAAVSVQGLSQEMARIVQFPAANPDDAINTMIEALTRRVNKRSDDLRDENAKSQAKIIELNAVVAEFATSNSDLKRLAAAVQAELLATKDLLARAETELESAREEIDQLKAAALAQEQSFAQKAIQAAAETNAQMLSLEEELREKSKWGRSLFWVTTIISAAVIIGAVVLHSSAFF